MENSKLGDYLKSQREEVGISMYKLAKESGLSHTYISQLEKGLKQNPSPDILRKLAKPLSVPYSELMIQAGYTRKATQEDIDAFYGFQHTIIPGAKSFSQILEQNHLENITNPDIEFVRVIEVIEAFLDKITLVGDNAKDLCSKFIFKLKKVGKEAVPYRELINMLFDPTSPDQKPIFTTNEDALVIEKMLQTIKTISEYKGNCYKLEEQLENQDEIMSDLLRYLVWGNFKYNTYELTQDEKSRIIDMLEIMFPDYV
ncbi:helix-turn-helix domain-containing protein [Paenibacillus yanchengensis]|uniref:Helix-turn-helix domain-containing protein n=1 Tax=Paenibacillus yanchengensis TaxID=2035833 RepID=A0ABW4YR08_9BACL